MRRRFGHVNLGSVVSFPAVTGDISLSSVRPVGAPLRGITGRHPRSGRLGKCKRSLERRTVPDFFSAAIDRCAIHKREHILGYQNLKVRHLWLWWAGTTSIRTPHGKKSGSSSWGPIRPSSISAGRPAGLPGPSRIEEIFSRFSMNRAVSSKGSSRRSSE